MASSAPMDKSDEMPEGDQSPETTGLPAAGDPWWRQWFGPAVAATIISALVIALATVGGTGFNSLKGDVRDLKLDITASETRVREDVKAFRAEVKDDLAGLRTDSKEEMKVFRAEVKEDMKEFRTEVKADLAGLRAENRALNDKLDRILEVVLAGQS